MAEIFSFGFLEYAHILIVGVLIYAIVFALLKKINVISDDPKINALIAILSAIIVSFTGVVTYAITYAVNVFAIIFFIVFLLMMLLMFLGVKMDDITKVVMNGGTIKGILVAFALIFAVIFFKGFFAVNNTFDINDPQNDSYKIDTSFNTGIDDITNKEINEGWFSIFFNNIDSDLLSASLFLGILGLFIFLIGK